MLQDLLLDNPRHGVCLPAPLTTTSRDQERASSLRPPLPAVGRAPGAEPLSPLALTRRPAPSWPQHRLVTGRDGAGRARGPRPAPRAAAPGGQSGAGDGAGTAPRAGTGTAAGTRTHVGPRARVVAPPPLACSQSRCPPAQHLRPHSALKGSCPPQPHRSPFRRSLPPAVSFIPLQPSPLQNSGSMSLHPRLWLHPPSRLWSVSQHHHTFAWASLDQAKRHDSCSFYSSTGKEQGWAR